MLLHLQAWSLRAPDLKGLLAQQHASLRKQIPLMYAIMFIDVIFLGIEAYSDVSVSLSLGVPVALTLAILVRTGIWIGRRSNTPQLKDVQRHIQGTIVTAAILSAVFGGWGLLLFNESDHMRSISIALYVFVGSISCCFCLQALPIAAGFVLLFGAMPVTVRLLMSSDWTLISAGANLLIVAVLILRTISTSYESLVQVLRSRSEMLVEQDRARAAEQKAQDLSYRDPLTELENRRALNERLARVESEPSPAASFALLMIDLDFFKSVNDVHGHAAGDQL